MSLRSLWQSWQGFLFKPASPIPIAVFRIMIGIIMLQSALIHVGPDFLFWYGPYGIVSLDALKHNWWLNEPRFDLLLLFPHTDAGAYLFWYIYLVGVVFMTLGLFTRHACILVFLCQVTMQNHQPFNINGGDAMIKLYSTYLMFSECGAALSLDRLMHRWKKPTLGEASRAKDVPPWGQRLIQIQLAIAYGQTEACKLSGKQWLDGTAVYYATRLQDLIRWSLPFFDSLVCCKLLTWGTLVIEAALCVLVWFDELCYWVLLGGVLLHLGIDYAINLPVFEWAFIAGLVTFVKGEDLGKIMAAARRRIRMGFGEPSPLFYNPASLHQMRVASLIEGLDIFHRITFTPVADQAELVVKTASGELRGLGLITWLSRQIAPMGWVFYPLLSLILLGSQLLKPPSKSEPRTS